MDDLLTPAQRSWFDAAVTFARSELCDDVADRDRLGTFHRDGYRKCGTLGLLGLPVPKEYGGGSDDLVSAVAAVEGLGYGCHDTGLVFALGASLWTVTMPILAFGTEEQKRRWLPGLCDGSLFGANAASEPEAGSDIFSMSTKAEKKADRWVLNGRKVWITGGAIADVLVVFATVDPGKGALGLTSFIVPKDTPGLRVVREIPKLGMRTAPMAELAFEDCELPLDAILEREGRGARVFNAALEWERGAILAGTLGTMRRQLERCVDHARKRKQFGQSIGKFQAVSHRLVDMKLRYETSRPLVYGFARKKARGEDATLEAAMAKLHVSECFVANSLDAVRHFGAQGYVTENGIERDLRDSVGGVIFSGTNDIQRNIIAARMKI
ncbi:acyl-CoA dehydrogenase family protein [Tautonia marina]|uniref:acyl-CoA dehydrogenase family protein n=1 Tax=Tautonia marina TaxID=2653855 RepID=UPI00126049A3|nr:acyl-CoA dehydrogenase family protein [Tautonia marina]